MKILSLNLHHHMEIDPYLKIEMIIEKVKLLDIDVVLLQEVGQYAKADIKYDDIKYGNYADTIAKLLPEYAVNINMFKLSYGGRYEEGLAVLYKKAIECQITSKIISNTKENDNWEKRGAMYVSIDNMTFVNLHLGWDTETENANQQLDELLAHQLNENVFLIGDFNFIPDSHTYNYLTNKEFFPLGNLETDSFKDEKGTERLDYCFTNSNLDCEFSFVFDNYEVSDHKAMYINILL